MNIKNQITKSIRSMLLSAALLITFVLSYNSATAQYCTPTPMYCYGYYSWIYEAKLYETNNPSNVVFDRISPAYETCYINTGVSGDLKLGRSYTLLFTNSSNYYTSGYHSYYSTKRVFVDWNTDGDFLDDGELVWYKVAYTGDWIYTQYNPTEITFTVPCTASGSARMRLMSTGFYNTASGNTSGSVGDACTNGYSYSGTYYYSYGEIEDYTLNFIGDVDASFPTTDDILYANELYDGTQRYKYGVLTDFTKPFVTFGQTQPTGTYLTYRIVGPLPSTNVVYQATDANGNTSIEVGGYRTYQVQNSIGSCSYPSGNGNGTFISTSGGEYKVVINVTGSGCPASIYKTFTVSWNNDLSVRDIVSPKASGAPRFFKYVRGQTIKISGQFQNVGLNNVTKFDAFTKIYNPNGTLIYSGTKRYDTANVGTPVLTPTTKVEIEFDNVKISSTGLYKMIMYCNLLNAYDQERYNDTLARQDNDDYFFEVQNEIQLQAVDIEVPEQSERLVGSRPVTPRGTFRNIGIYDASDVPAWFVVKKLPSNFIVYKEKIKIQDIPAGTYNTTTVDFPVLTLKESGTYQACMYTDLPDEQIRIDDTTCVTFSVEAGMLGEYTVGNKYNNDTYNYPTGRNFPTIDSAMNSLYYRGLAGSVTFLLTDANYAVTSKDIIYPAWDMSSYIINSGVTSDNTINTITWRPSDDRLMSRASVTINLNTKNGKGILFGQNIKPANSNAIFQQYWNKQLGRTYANNQGYITFEGGPQKSLKFVLNSTSTVSGIAFYLGKGSNNITVNNCIIQNGTQGIADKVMLPMVKYSPSNSAFTFDRDTVLTTSTRDGYSAGVVVRSSLYTDEELVLLKLDTVPCTNNKITNNEISDFGYGIMSVGIGQLWVNLQGKYIGYYNQNNNYSDNLIYNIAKAGIYLGNEDSPTVFHNKISNIGKSTMSDAAGIIAGGDGSQTTKGYHNINAKIDANEINGVLAYGNVYGIKIEQDRSSFPTSDPLNPLYHFPEGSDNFTVINNSVWGLKAANNTLNRYGILYNTERERSGSISPWYHFLTPVDDAYFTSNNTIANNTIIMSDDDNYVTMGNIAGLVIQNMASSIIKNNAIAIFDNDVDDASNINAAVFYQGQLPSKKNLTFDRNAYWYPASSNASVYRFVEEDTEYNETVYGNNDDYKLLNQWQIWTNQDDNSVFGNFYTDMQITGSDPNRRLRVITNPLPLGSMLNNRGDVITSITEDIDGNVRGAASQRYDIGASEFNGRSNISDLAVNNITYPAVYRSTSDQFSDAEYFMVQSPANIKAKVRNNGSLKRLFANITVNVYLESVTSTETAPVFNTTPELTKTVQVDIDPADTYSVDFDLTNGSTIFDLTKITYNMLIDKGYLYSVPERFKTMTANVTPLVKITVNVDADQVVDNNELSKIVRYYTPRSSMKLCITAENSFENISMNSPVDIIAGKLNYDSLIKGMGYLGWKVDLSKGLVNNVDMNVYDFDIFDRASWEPKAVDYTMFRSIMWSDGDDKPLSRYERKTMKLFNSSGASTNKKNLIICSQELVRQHGQEGVNTPDLAFTNDILRATYVEPGNPMGENQDNNGNIIRGMTIGRNLSDVILNTTFTGDAASMCGLMAVNQNLEGLSLPAYYYSKQTRTSADSIMGVATTTLVRNAVYLGVDWRHFGNINYLIRAIFDFCNNNGSLVIPVDLTAFQAQLNGNKVDLFWTTETEYQSNRFEVERATNSTSGYTKIATVDANGTSHSPINYGPVFDYNISNGNKYFYRLKMVDINGDWKYSDPVEVNVANDEFFYIGDAKPNPANSFVKFPVSLSSKSDIDVLVYDMKGNIVTPAYQLNNGELTVNLSTLSSGTYSVVLKSGETQLVKQFQVVK